MCVCVCVCLIRLREAGAAAGRLLSPQPLMGFNQRHMRQGEMKWGMEGKDVG